MRPMRAMAKVRAMAKAPAGRGRGAMRAIPAAKAKPKARVGRVRIRRPAMRRNGGAVKTPEEKWRDKEEIPSEHVKVEDLGRGAKVVVTAGHYFHRGCKIAGEVAGLEVLGGEVYMQMRLSGTNDEGILRVQSTSPETTFRVHKCPADCNREESSDNLVHAEKMRAMKAHGEEEDWTLNLDKVLPAEDELAALRMRADAARAGMPLNAGPDPKEDEKKDKKEKKKKKKEKKEKKAKGDDSDQPEIAMDGSRSRQASRKKQSHLFGGTGLDPDLKVRSKAARAAKRFLKKKGTKSSSSSSSSSGSAEEDPTLQEEEDIFAEGSKTKAVADSFPGVLSAQTLTFMRSTLLQDIGSADAPRVLKDVVVAYLKQNLQRKISGPQMREMLTLATTADLLLRGNPSKAMDVVLQRFKSCESAIAGAHWTVAQGLELLPMEGVTATPAMELQQAKKRAFQDAKLRWEASGQDGRPKGGKGQKGNQYERQDPKKGDRKGGKNQGNKGDGKRGPKDENAAKT